MFVKRASILDFLALAKIRNLHLVPAFEASLFDVTTNYQKRWDGLENHTLESLAIFSKGDTKYANLVIQFHNPF